MRRSLQGAEQKNGADAVRRAGRGPWAPTRCGPAPARARALLSIAMLAAALAAQGREAPALANDPALEARVMAVAEELRCLVCQNETIAASHADLAVDLRNQIRQQITQGRSEAQIKDYMVQRYGEFVLYRPRWELRTWALWAGPFALLALAGWALVRNIARRRPAALAAEAELSAADAARARRLLDVPAATER